MGVRLIKFITIAPAFIVLDVGEFLQFQVIGNLISGNTIDLTTQAKYKSSDPQIVKVNDEGLATAIKSGTAEITATFRGLHAIATIQVSTNLTGITIEPTSVTLQVGDTQQFTVTGQFSDGSTQDLTSQASYVTSNSNVVTIDSGGFATAVAIGSASIIATLDDFSVTATLEIQTIVIPPLDMSVPTSIFAQSEFLYTGDNPIQTGVEPETIELRRAAVLRGQVFTSDGEPLSGVNISILAHPEFGQTITREDGQFDMAVNGGELLVVRYKRDGLRPVQRQIKVPWEEFVILPDVMMIALDPVVTTIDLIQPDIQTARGSQVTDADGTRQATLLFPPGNTATMILPDGTSQGITTLNVRATEYSAGENGPSMMPALLPPTSAYTYCVEFSADEELAAGAREIRFDQPISFYVENFLEFPVGGAVPTGFYDRTLGEWSASQNGQVIQIVSITGGLADLDIDGDGVADSPDEIAELGINNAERQRLANLYQIGQSLWRVPITHFSAPWDCNWPYGFPDDAEPPRNPDPFDKPSVDNPCNKQGGSTIVVQTQALGEDIVVTGTPFRMHYQSDRVRGSKDAYTLEIPVSGANIPESALGIRLDIFVAGRSFTEFFPRTATNHTHTFVWDGKDAYGRVMQGAQPITVRVRYEYPLIYLTPAAFQFSFGRIAGASGGGGGGGGGGVAVPLIFARRGDPNASLGQEFKGFIGTFDTKELGLGGWTLPVHHFYDPSGEVLFLGDGQRRSAEALSNIVITTVAGGGNPPDGLGDGGQATQANLSSPEEVTVGPDGSLYIAEFFSGRIRRVGPDGIITTVAGGGNPPDGLGDGGPATQASLNNPTDVTVGPDGSLYIADRSNSRIRRIGPDEIITTVAGTGVQGSSGDGGPATQAQLEFPFGVAVGSDRSLYIAEFSRIRSVGPDGIITTVAGGGNPPDGLGDGGPATQAQLRDARDVAVGSDGSLFIADAQNFRIRRVGPDGTITTVAGGGNPPDGLGDGGPATQALLNAPIDVAVGPDGSFYISEFFSNRIRRVDQNGIINTVAGGGTPPDRLGDGGPATQGALSQPSGVDVGLDGSFYIADYVKHRIRRVNTVLPEFSITDILIPFLDGNEVFIFNGSGKHLRTIDALTGAIRFQFIYNSSGLLVQVEDEDGNITIIERDDFGNPTSIYASGGQRTALTVDSNGFLDTIINPAGEAFLFQYTMDGLMTRQTNPRGNISHYDYDELGRLIRVEDAAGAVTTLMRTENTDGLIINLTSALGRVTTFRVEKLATGGQRSVNTLPSGHQIVEEIGTDSTRTVMVPDGRISTQTLGPDPRFGMLIPLMKSQMIRTPGGLISNLKVTRSVSLSDSSNPLSLQNQIDTVDLNGRSYTTTFNAATRRIIERSPSGREIVTTLNALGRVIEGQITGLTPVTFTYDSRGQVVAITQGDRTFTLTYDNSGNLVNIDDPLSRSVGFTYDTTGQIISLTLQDGRQLQFAYDANGNEISVSPPGRPEHLFTYNEVDLVSAYIPPDAGAGTERTDYIYNLDRQITGIIRPDGESVSLAYDSFGRLNTVTHPAKTITIAYNSSTGNVSSITSSEGESISYVYDGQLLTRRTWSGTISGSVQYTYDNDHWITSQSINGENTVNFQYDLDGLLIEAGELTLDYLSQNNLISGTTLDNVIDILTYNSFGEVTSYSASYDNTNLFLVQYELDGLGRITQKTETISGTAHTFQYSYDPVGQLTEVREDGALTSSYTYDTNGNRLTFTDQNGSISGTYDTQDRLLQYGTKEFNYTPNGELQQSTDTATNQTTEFTYDALGNLTSVTFPNNIIIEYVIDSTNRRIGKKINGTLVQGFLYKNRLHPVAELDSENNVVSRFIYASRRNVPDVMIKEGIVYRIISDNLDSPRLVVNVATGQIAQEMDYDEFGNVILDTNPGFQPFGYAGGLYDTDTKLVRFGTRDYDPETGRWMIKDPIGFQGGYANLYGYVGNDPINFSDPTGLQTLFETFRRYYVFVEIFRHLLNPPSKPVGDPYQRPDVRLEESAKKGPKKEMRKRPGAGGPDDDDEDGNDPPSSPSSAPSSCPTSSAEGSNTKDRLIEGLVIGAIAVGVIALAIALPPLGAGVAAGALEGGAAAVAGGAVGGTIGIAIGTSFSNDSSL